jgi:hypothetical protein
MDIFAILLGLLADPVAYIAGTAFVLLAWSTVRDWRSMSRKRSRQRNGLISEQLIYYRQNQRMDERNVPPDGTSSGMKRQSSSEAT